MGANAATIDIKLELDGRGGVRVLDTFTDKAEAAGKKVDSGFGKARRTLATFNAKVAQGTKYLAGMARSAVNLAGKLALGGAIVGVAALTAGLYALKKVLGLVTDAAGVQEAAEADLDAVLKATGGVAGYTAEELKKMASQMQSLTKVGDEAIIAGEAIMLTFKNVAGEGFEKAMWAALDMSQVMKQDLKSSVVMIGKALNDPIAGLSALTRVGVTFTEEQKNMVKALQESGDLMGAQNIVLQELNSQFGGAAAAAATNYHGKLQQLKNVWGDLLEEMGFVITKNEYFGSLVDRLKEVVSGWIGRLSEWRQANSELIAQRVEEYLQKSVDWISKGYTWITKTVTSVRDWYRANQQIIESSFVLTMQTLGTLAEGVATAFLAVGKGIGYAAAEMAGFIEQGVKIQNMLPGIWKAVAAVAALIDKIGLLDKAKATVEFQTKASPEQPFTQGMNQITSLIDGFTYTVASANPSLTVNVGPAVAAIEAVNTTLESKIASAASYIAQAQFDMENLRNNPMGMGTSSVMKALSNQVDIGYDMIERYKRQAEIESGVVQNIYGATMTPAATGGGVNIENLNITVPGAVAASQPQDWSEITRLYIVPELERLSG